MQCSKGEEEALWLGLPVDETHVRSNTPLFCSLSHLTLDRYVEENFHEYWCLINCCEMLQEMKHFFRWVQIQIPIEYASKQNDQAGKKNCKIRKIQDPSSSSRSWRVWMLIVNQMGAGGMNVSQLSSQQFLALRYNHSVPDAAGCLFFSLLPKNLLLLTRRVWGEAI